MTKPAKKAKRRTPMPKRAPADVEHEGMRPTPEAVMGRLVDRNVDGKLSELAKEYRCASLELCGLSRQVPIPEARTAFWGYLKDDAGWSVARIAEVWGTDHSTVASALRNS